MDVHYALIENMSLVQMGYVMHLLLNVHSVIREKAESTAHIEAVLSAFSRLWWSLTNALPHLLDGVALCKEAL